MFENYSNGLMELSKWNSVCADVCVLVIQLCPTLVGPHRQCSVYLLSTWNSSGKNTGVMDIPFSRGSS